MLTFNYVNYKDEITGTLPRGSYSFNGASFNLSLALSDIFVFD